MQTNVQQVTHANTRVRIHTAALNVDVTRGMKWQQMELTAQVN